MAHIVDEDPNANWITQSISINYLTVFGAKTVNSINLYPDLDKWHQLDVDNKSEEIYNRHAHVVVDLVNDNNTSFELISANIMLVKLNVNDLSKLNVSYIASPNNLEELNNDNVTFSRIYDAGNCKIYKINYSK